MNTENKTVGFSKIFNEAECEVRVVMENERPFFVAKDIATSLGYKNSNDAIKKHCRGVAKRYPIVDSLNRTQQARIISEADTLRLIISSKLPAAEAFEAWIMEEVIPSVMSTGSYTAPGASSGSSIVESKYTKLLESHIELLKDQNNSLKSRRTARKPKNNSNRAVTYRKVSEVGFGMGVSAQAVNQMLTAKGMQVREANGYKPTSKGKKLCRVIETSGYSFLTWCDDIEDHLV